MNAYGIIENLALTIIFIVSAVAAMRRLAPGLWRKLTRQNRTTSTAGCDSGCGNCGSGCDTPAVKPLVHVPKNNIS